MKHTTPTLPEREAAILETVIEPTADTLPKSVARYFLSLKLRKANTDRVNALSAKARAGTLTHEDGEELDSYLRIGHLLSMMKSKARRSLKRESSSGHG
jgi:hypothetical protein